MSQRNLGNLDRDIVQPLGRIIQEAFSDGLVSQGPAFFGSFAAPMTMTASQLNALMASGDIASALGGSTCVRNFWSRAKVSVAQTAGGSVYGAVNQLRMASVAANYAMSSAGVYAGAWNVFEASDAEYDITFTNLKAIGCHAKLEIATGHTISSGSFHGVNISNAVIPTMASATSFAGLYIEKDGGAQDWTIGIDVNNCTTGIDIGDATTGITISGATTTGISITGLATTGLSIVAGTTQISTSGTLTGATGRAAKFSGTITNANYGDGYGFAEVEMNLAGTTAGHLAALTSWVNIGSGIVAGDGGTFVAAQNNGIWEDSGATITGASLVFGMRASCVVGDNDELGTWPFSLNVSGTITDALFLINTAAIELGEVTDAGSDTGKLVPLYQATPGGAKAYVKIYTHT